MPSVVGVYSLFNCLISTAHICIVLYARYTSLHRCWRQSLFWSLFVCLSLSVVNRIAQKLWTHFHEIWTRKEFIKFCKVRIRVRVRVRAPARLLLAVNDMAWRRYTLYRVGLPCSCCVVMHLCTVATSFAFCYSWHWQSVTALLIVLSIKMSHVKDGQLESCINKTKFQHSLVVWEHRTISTSSCYLVAYSHIGYIA